MLHTRAWLDVERFGRHCNKWFGNALGVLVQIRVWLDRSNKVGEGLEDIARIGLAVLGCNGSV